jgi:hypothetical protein
MRLRSAAMESMQAVKRVEPRLQALAVRTSMACNRLSGPTEGGSCRPLLGELLQAPRPQMSGGPVLACAAMDREKGDAPS